MNSELAEEPQNAARFGCARRVVIPRHDDHRRVGESSAQATELEKRMHDRRVRRPHVVKHVATDEHQVRPQRDDAIDRGLKRPRDIRLPLVDAAGSESLVLTKSEVQVR